MQLEPWVPPCVLFGWWSSPQEFQESGQLALLLRPWGCKPFSSFGPLFDSSLGDSVLSPMVDCKHLTLNLQPHGGINSANWTDPPTPTPRVPVDWDTNQRVHMEGPMAPAAYVAEDGLI